MVYLLRRRAHGTRPPPGPSAAALQRSAIASPHHERVSPETEPAPAVLLVVAAEPVLAALLGAFVELDGAEVTFPQEGETVRDALRRTRPRALLCDLERLDEESVGPAMMLGVRVILFGPEAKRRELVAAAARLDVDCLVVPSGLERIVQRLRDEGRERGADDER